MGRLIPDTIATRTMLVLIIGLTVSHAVSVGLYITDRTNALLFTGGQHTGERIATIAQLVDDESQADRMRIVELADNSKFHVTWTQQSATEDQRDGGWQADVLRDALAAHLRTDGSQVFRLRYTERIITEPWQRHLRQRHDQGDPGETLLVSLRLRDGSWVNFAAPVGSPEPFWSLRFALSLVVMLLTVGAVSALVVHHWTKPLAIFARAAARLGTDMKAAPLPESGPAEVRHATRAFNEMQGRVRRFVEDRTQMMAAISHDLGTPITRLRLRAEFIDDEEQRKKMLADLDDMEKMVFAALSFARDDAANEPAALVDLRSLLQRVCDDITDAGFEVSMEVGEKAVRYGCQPAALRRALTNLIDNAVKYGGRARVSLRDDDNAVLIRIDDDGPGIPEELREDAFRPFRRLEASRNQETGGTGLGLAVARTIIRAHGGDIRLMNRSKGGLRADVKLPR